MLHIRFHRRTPSNPTSPVLDRSSWDTTAVQPANLVPVDGVPAPDIRPRSATSAPFAHAHGQSTSPSLRDQNPPVLPPIARVVSADSELSIYSQSSDQKPTEDAKPGDEPKPLPRSPYTKQSKFIGGLALENYRREQAALSQPTQPQRSSIVPPIPSASPSVSPSGAGISIPPLISKPQPPVPPPARPARVTSSFVSPTDLQNAPPTGKRPPGARMASDQSVASTPPVTRDAAKAKKGLPFLKNPMSTLLARRKTSQNVPDLTLSTAEPAYDPRIRGTRVHDFSNPRPWKPVVRPSNVAHEPMNPGEVQASHSKHNTPVVPSNPAPPVPPKDEHVRSSRTSSSYSKGHSMDATLSQRSRDSSATQLAEMNTDEAGTRRRKSALSRVSMSRKTSAASMKSSFSAIPKHMKSTSSRFSFDMIGAAEEEKLLEERHRQRQQDKASGVSEDRRDSRFDEFDEDGFDYDAMDYDDGLEERIPGVNADFDDYEDDIEAANDPDNDQDNFAGFVFQRSEPVSSLTSPYGPVALPTPRDANGNIIGYARTGDTPSSEQFPGASPGLAADTQPSQFHNESSSTGLGIQDLGSAMESPEVGVPQPQAQKKTHLSKDDELYFNDGLIHDFDGEGDGSAFDESIFDLNDTDQYGRPIPQMFANALAQRNAAVETKKRESDMTSRLSAQSAISHSTAHTSLSVEAHSKITTQQVEETTSHVARPRDEADMSHMAQLEEESQQALSGLESNTMAAYQAALAAAAHQAAASGKFRRDSSPEPPRDLTVTSPTTSGSSYSQQDVINENELDDYEYDDGFSAGLDDYELDDDAIIAEANASALANDSDGWYGQEFGFYSAPLPQSSHNQSSLSEKNLFQYSHGGYFGPSGVTRSTSGRVVSREPNLTPITERSEYSNRNSLMSIGWPGPSSSGAIQSPGLAQLAMMAEDHDMSLSALLKLRNKAWGGSQVSLSSSREGSPYDRNGATSPLGQDLGGNNLGPGRKNSTFSIYSQDSTGAGSDTGSPTITMAIPSVNTHSIPSLAMSPSSAASPIPAPVFSPLLGSTTFPPLSEVEEPVSPERAGKPAHNTNDSAAFRQRPGMGHRRVGSADRPRFGLFTNDEAR